MPFRIGLYTHDEYPLARTAGFKQELVRVADGDKDVLSVLPLNNSNAVSLSVRDAPEAA
jgi:hypothetical protein